MEGDGGILQGKVKDQDKSTFGKQAHSCYGKALGDLEKGITLCIRAMLCLRRVTLSPWDCLGSV